MPDQSAEPLIATEPFPSGKSTTLAVTELFARFLKERIQPVLNEPRERAKDRIEEFMLSD